jgi:hypothetical protein
MKLVIIESPYAGGFFRRMVNRRYARKCMKHAIMRGEAPFASHLLYTQRGIMRDADKSERKCGIDAGLAWGIGADLVAVYTDCGISSGMHIGITEAIIRGTPVKYRSLRG